MTSPGSAPERREREAPADRRGTFDVKHLAWSVGAMLFGVLLAAVSLATSIDEHFVTRAEFNALRDDVRAIRATLDERRP